MFFDRFIINKEVNLNMKNQKFIDKIKKIAQKIGKEYQVEKIILFGSYAWGNPTQDSDFDLLIVKKEKKDFIQEQQKIREVIDGELPVDILIYTPKELDKRLEMGDFFFQDVINKGIIIYGE